MKPLFGSSDPTPLSPELRWFIPPRDGLTLKPMILAGAAVGLHTHRVGFRTLPCLHQWPDLGLECPHCERSRRFTCWVPVVPIHDADKQWVVMGGLNTYQSVKKFERGHLVECVNAKVIKPTLIFRSFNHPMSVVGINRASEKWNPYFGDITRWLLHYWQWPALTTCFNEKHRESRKVSAAKERARENGFSFLQPGEKKAD